MNAALRGAAALALSMLLALAGCSKEISAHGPAADLAYPAEKKVLTTGDARRATLATTRHVDIEVAPDAVAPLFGSTQAACESDTANACVVMASNLRTGERTHAELTLRAAPAGIARLLAKLHAGQGLVSETTESEDLGGPIVDAERQIAMKREYRDSLLALRARSSNDIKTLMAVNEELAKVQSQLESVTGDRAHLQQRIDTETLVIVIDTTGEHETHAWRSIGDAFREFGAHLAEAAASAITFVAYAIPWFFVLLPLSFGLRRLWRRRKAAQR